MKQDCCDAAAQLPPIASAQRFDLLSYIFKIHLIIDCLAGCEAAEQVGLMFGPDQDIRVVIAHRHLHATDPPYAARYRGVRSFKSNGSIDTPAAASAQQMNCFWVNPSAMARSTSTIAAPSPIFTFTIPVRRSGCTIAGGSAPPPRHSRPV